MKQIIIVLLVIVQYTALYSQWISNFSGSGNYDTNIENARGTAIVSDNLGNCYVTGYYYGNSTGSDIITIKYDQYGDTIWVKYFNGNANLNDEGTAVAIDSNNNIYVAGFSNNVNTSNDFTVLKYNSAGNLLWQNTLYVYEQFADDKATDIAIDHNNNVIITGYGTTAAGNTILVTRKLSESGTVEWTSTETSFSGNSQAVKLAVNGTGDIFVSGFVSTGGLADMIVIKYNESGNKIFQQVIGGEGEDKAWGIAVDDDCVIITGYITNSAGNTDCYTAKFSPTGSSLWFAAFNGTGNGEDKAWGIAVDDDAAVYINGNTTDFYGNMNYITLKYSSSGTQLWAAEYNGPGNGRDQANAIGIIYRNGTAEELVTAGESIGVDNNYDYATVRYSIQTGDEISVSRYSFSNNTDDRPLDIAISVSNGKIYLTGYSQLIAEDGMNSFSSSISSLMYESSIHPIKNSGSEIPTTYKLHQNFPNPFNPSTNIHFSIPLAAHVKLTVYDINGKEVKILANGPMLQGNYVIQFTSEKLASGVYFYILKSGNFTAIKKMIFLK